MLIEVVKFGKMLISRPAGKEAASIILSSFKPQSNTEIIELDFTGVEVVGPSWLDEVLMAIQDRYEERVKIKESTNSSLNESIKVIRDLG